MILQHNLHATMAHNLTVFLHSAVLTFACFSLFSVAQAAQDFPVSAYECTQVSLDDVDESLLTREERIARMDIALSDSIDSYTSCVNTVQNEMSGGGSGAGSGSGAESSEGSDQQHGQGDATEQSNPVQQSNGSPQAGSEPTRTQNQTTTNAPRGVIAPKDNDSIICKLLFDEMQKTNGASLAGLEKQYRDYQCGK